MSYFIIDINLMPSPRASTLKGINPRGREYCVSLFRQNLLVLFTQGIISP